jgi:hypothetical protein
VRIDQRPVTERIIESLRYFADLVTSGKTRHRRGGICSQIRPMHFKPQALGTLTE